MYSWAQPPIESATKSASPSFSSEQNKRISWVETFLFRRLVVGQPPSAVQRSEAPLDPCQRRKCRKCKLSRTARLEPLRPKLPLSANFAAENCCLYEIPARTTKLISSGCAHHSNQEGHHVGK